MSDTCELCGEPMSDGEAMFKYHGYSGPCPKPPKAKPTTPAPAALSEVDDEVAVAAAQYIIGHQCEGVALARGHCAWCDAYFLIEDQAARIAELERPVEGGEVYESARTEPSIKVRGVGRDLFEPRSASVALTDRPTNEELISLHEYLRGWKP